MTQFDESKVRRDADGQFASKGPAAEDTSVQLADPQERIDWKERTGLDEGEILDAATKSANYFARRYQIEDKDDLAAEAVAEYLHQVSSGDRRAPGKDKGYNPEGHIRRITQGLAQRIASGHKHGGPNLTGTKRYLEEREKYESSTGEAMSASEEDELADRIRREWTGARKPDIGFHRARSLNRGTDSLDQIRESRDGDESSLAFESHAPSTEELALGGGTEFEEGSVGDRIDRRLAEAMVPLEKGASATERKARTAEMKDAKDQARRALWSVLSANSQAPNVPSGSISSQQAVAMRRSCQNHGGARALVSKFDRGELTEAESAALFAPWGKAGQNGTNQERIAETLSVSPAMTDDIWDAAVYSGTSEG